MFDIQKYHTSSALKMERTKEVRPAVDAQEKPLNIIGTAKPCEVQRYVSLTSHVYSALPFLVSDITWSKLPADERRIVAQAAKLSPLRERQAARESRRAVPEDAGEQGHAIEKKPDRDKFAAVIMLVWAEHAKKYGAEASRLIEVVPTSRH